MLEEQLKKSQEYWKSLQIGETVEAASQFSKDLFRVGLEIYPKRNECRSRDQN